MPRLTARTIPPPTPLSPSLSPGRTLERGGGEGVAAKSEAEEGGREEGEGVVERVAKSEVDLFLFSGFNFY